MINERVAYFTGQGLEEKEIDTNLLAPVAEFLAIFPPISVNLVVNCRDGSVQFDEEEGDIWISTFALH
jgi:hypothetical protein